MRQINMSKLSLGLAATVLLIQINPAAAQTSEDVLEEVVIEMPALVTHDVWKGRQRFKAWDLSQSVSYSDLDLTLHKDVAELKRRIETAAQKVCKALADKKPRLRNPKPICIRKAVYSATEEMNLLVAAAN